MAESIGVRDSKLISVNVHRYATEIASFLVDPGELIRIYNQENLCRSAVQGTISGDFVHIEFILRKFRFVALVAKPEAASFMAIAGQRRIAGAEPDAKRPPLKRLSPKQPGRYRGLLFWTHDEKEKPL